MYKRAFYLALLLVVLGLPTASAVAEPAVTVDYYTVTGSVFSPTNSGVSWSYPGFGCLETTGTNLFHAPVNLPSGATVTAITFGFNNKVALAASVSASFIRFLFSGGNITSTSINVFSGLVQGYSTKTLSGLNMMIDNSAYNYILSWPGNANQSLCFIRLTYTKPTVFGLAMPLVTR